MPLPLTYIRKKAMTIKQTVLDAMTELLVKRDPAAVDTYISSDYVQHGSPAGDGPTAVRNLVDCLGESFGYDNARVLADKDLVVAHGVYRGFGPEPLVAFDLFRVADGKLVEHWIALTPQITETVSGHSQVDGPVDVEDLERTDANRDLVREFVTRVLVGGDYAAMSDYFDADTYIQHNPAIGDGLTGLLAALEKFGQQGITMEYSQLHRVVAEGQFVFTQSEGTFGGKPYAFYDLFRVAKGRIAEHWDVMAEGSDVLAQGDGASED